MELPSREEYASSAQQEEAVPGQVGEDLDIEDITAAPAVPLSDIGSVEDSEGDIQMDEVIDVQASQEEGLLLQAARDLIGGSEPRLFSPSPSPDAGRTEVDTATRVDAQALRALNSQQDLIRLWPYAIPQYLLKSPYYGDQPNPHHTLRQQPSHSALLERILPLLGHNLSALWHSPRRAVEHMLQVTSSAIRLAERAMHERDRDWIMHELPEAMTDERLQRMDDALNPITRNAVAPKTLGTALKSLGVDDSLVVHPMCRNHDCSEVFYSIVRREDFGVLAPLCPSCSTPTRNAVGKLEILQFARRSLVLELETVMRVPGLEDAVELRGERKSKRDAEDESMAGGATWGRVYRQQDDGDAWGSRTSANPALASALSMEVNLGIDWANPSSNRSAASDSMGPISLQIADLPAQLRSSFSCLLLVGITPGPKQPAARNLYKLLLPLTLELRAAELHGLWIRTPKHPSGKYTLQSLSSALIIFKVVWFESRWLAFAPIARQLLN